MRKLTKLLRTPYQLGMGKPDPTPSPLTFKVENPQQYFLQVGTLVTALVLLIMCMPVTKSHYSSTSPFCTSPIYHKPTRGVQYLSSTAKSPAIPCHSSVQLAPSCILQPNEATTVYPQSLGGLKHCMVFTTVFKNPTKFF